jgi:hypothetical protein
MSKHDGGKGSRPRPFSVSNQDYAERWDAIFGRTQRCPKCESEELTRGQGVVAGAQRSYEQCLNCGHVWGME